MGKLPFLKKFKRKILFETQKLNENFLLIFSRYDENLIIFDGGLGSQILSYYQYEYLLRKGHRPQVNIKYYIETEEKLDSNLERRQWALDRYGISLDKFKEDPASITESYMKIPTNLLTRKHINYFEKFYSLDLREKLPTSTKEINKYLKMHQVFSEYYAIHIRGGDYYTAASLMVPEEDILRLINKLFPNFVRQPIFVFSDSEIKDSIVEILKHHGYSKIILCGPNTIDQFITHDLMRNAKILITSNSTFSLSAGLLAKDTQLTLVPMKFYSGYRDAPANLLINELSNFSLLSRKF